MRGVDEVGSVAFGSTLKAELTVSGDWVVEEGDAVGQLSVVENLLVVIAQGLTSLGLELELVLVAGPQPVHGAHLVRVERLAEQVDGRHLTAEQSILNIF